MPPECFPQLSRYVPVLPLQRHPSRRPGAVFESHEFIISPDLLKPSLFVSDVCMYMDIHFIYTYMYMCIYTCVSTRIHIYICIYVYTCIHIYICAFAHICMYKCRFSIVSTTGRARILCGSWGTYRFRQGCHDRTLLGG